MADQGAEGVLSPYLRRKRIEAVAPWLKGRVLDFGCGVGVLAGLVSAARYLGVERDEASLKLAKINYPKHHFASRLPESSEKFDTVVALAVIEHVGEPTELLTSLAELPDDSHLSRIVITTPHPSVDWVHSLGARFGIFSRHASDEHEDLLDHARLNSVGLEANLTLQAYSRFLFGANQIAIYSKKKI